MHNGFMTLVLMSQSLLAKKRACKCDPFFCANIGGALGRWGGGGGIAGEQIGGIVYESTLP